MKHKKQKSVKQDYYVKVGLVVVVALAILGLFYTYLGSRERVGQATYVGPSTCTEGSYYLYDTNGDGVLDFTLCRSGLLGSCDGTECTTTKKITINPSDGAVRVDNEVVPPQTLREFPLSVGTRLAITVDSPQATSTPGTHLVFDGWDAGAVPGTGGEVIVTTDEAYGPRWRKKHQLSSFAGSVGTPLSGSPPSTVTLTPAGETSLNQPSFYDEGLRVTATAGVGQQPTPTSRYVFDKWEVQSGSGILTPTDSAGNIIRATQYEFSVERPSTIRALFRPQVQAAVAVIDNGYGSVTAASGIDCGKDCADFYDQGSLVTLTATAEPGSLFSGWGGLCEAVGTPKVPQLILLPATVSTKTPNLVVGPATGAPAITGDLQGQTQYVGAFADGVQSAVSLPLSPEIGSATYTFNVPVAGEYRISLGVATQNSASGACEQCAGMQIDTQAATRFSIDNTGSFDTFKAMQSEAVTLTQGQHSLKVTIYNSNNNNAAFRFAWVKLTPTSPLPTSGTCALTMDAAKAATAGFKQEFVTDVKILPGWACESGYTKKGEYYPPNSLSGEAQPVRSFCVKKAVWGPFISALQFSLTAGVCSSPSTATGGLTSSSTLCKTSGNAIYTDAEVGALCSPGYTSIGTFVVQSDLNQAQYNLCTKGITYALTVEKAGTGSGTVTGEGIDCGSDCDERHAGGRQVTLTAVPAVGAIFDGWSGPGINCPGTGTCTVTMDTRKSVTATFKALTGFVTCTIPLTEVTAMDDGPDGIAGTADDTLTSTRTTHTQPVGTTLSAPDACVEYRVFGTEGKQKVDVNVNAVSSAEVVSNQPLEFLRCSLDCSAVANAATIQTCKALTEIPDTMAPVNANPDPADAYFIITPEQRCGVN